MVLLDYGEDVEGEPAGEREGELVKRRQAGTGALAPWWRGRNSSSASLSVLCSSSSKEVSARGNLTPNLGHR